MLTERLPLLWAFAGGCLSGVLALGLWRAESAVASHPSRASLSRATDERVQANGAPSEAREAVPAVRSTEHETPAIDGQSETSAGTAPAKADDADAPADQGSSVAEVLNRLESQYRQVLAGTTAPGAPERAPAVPAAAAVAAAPSGLVAGAAPAEAPAHAAAVREEPAPAPAAPAPKSAPPPAAEPVAPRAEVAQAAPVPPSAVPAEVAERLAAQGAAQPRDVYLGNVQNNVYLGNVYQGQVVQMQQELAMLQYMQLLSLSPYARFGGRGRGVPRGFAAQPAPAPAFHSGLTNPDNPWGFDFPPTNYVK
jgi:hypothetical protein